MKTNTKIQFEGEFKRKIEKKNQIFHLLLQKVFHTQENMHIFFNEALKQKINKVPVPNMDTLRKMYFFHPRVHVIGLQKCITTISGLLAIVTKN